MQPATQVGRRTVSLVVAIIMLIIGAAAGAAVAYVAVPRTGTSTSNLCSSGRTLTIGALLDLSSDLSNQGNRAKFSSQMAIDDVNAFLTQGGCNLKFAINVNDYALDNQKGLTALQSFAASGVQIVVGPLNSGTAQFILSYANTNHIVLISPSSTSPALALDNDYLFRTVPNDAAQGLADARMMADRGAKAVIIVHRHDTYGDGLANATANRFTSSALGGTLISKIPYDTTTTDFSAVLTTLNNDYNTANSNPLYANKVAIDAITFEEFRTLIIQANQQHPALLSTPLPWFGTDGTADNSVISSNATAGPLVAQVKLPSTLYAPTNNTKTVDLINRYSSAHSGDRCDAYCLGAYDDVWLAAQATLQAGSYDGTAIQKVLSTVASNTFGVTGWLGLETSGDRVPTSYQIWKVITPSAPTWVLAGTWDKSTDTITWISPP